MPEEISSDNPWDELTEDLVRGWLLHEDFATVGVIKYVSRSGGDTLITLTNAQQLRFTRELKLQRRWGFRFTDSGHTYTIGDWQD